jgi:hypothetical protein
MDIEPGEHSLYLAQSPVQRQRRKARQVGQASQVAAQVVAFALASASTILI